MALGYKKSCKSEELKRGEKIVRWLKVFAYSIASIPTACCFCCGLCGTFSGPRVLFDEEVFDTDSSTEKRAANICNQALMGCFSIGCMPMCCGCCCGVCGVVDPSDALQCCTN